MVKMKNGKPDVPVNDPRSRNIPAPAMDMSAKVRPGMDVKITKINKDKDVMNIMNRGSNMAGSASNE